MKMIVMINVKENVKEKFTSTDTARNRCKCENEIKLGSPREVCLG